MTLTNTTNPDPSGPESNGNLGYSSTLLRAQELQPHHRMQFSIISWIRLFLMCWFTPLQRMQSMYSRISFISDDIFADTSIEILLNL